MAAAMAGMVVASSAAAAVLVRRRCVGYATELVVDLCELAEVAERGKIRIEVRLPDGPCRLGSMGGFVVASCPPICEVRIRCRAEMPGGWYPPGGRLVLGG